MKKVSSTDLIAQQDKRLSELVDLGHDKQSFRAGFFEGYCYAHASEIKGDFKARLVIEYAELKDKTAKLITFLKNYENSSLMEQHHWNIITVQRDIMVSYVSILEMRLIKLDMQDCTYN